MTVSSYIVSEEGRFLVDDFIMESMNFLDIKKSELAEHAYEKICWIEAKFLQIEPNATYRK
jgi:hypothetical protein